MSNAYLPEVWDELVYRLALGLEAVDYCRRGRISHPIQVTVDGPLAPTVTRYDSCLHVLLYSHAVRSPVSLRLLDDSRRYVPRRLQVPIVTEAAATAGDPPANPVPVGSRTWRPALFPGAAYDVSESTTGLRGRVEVGGKPLRWARVTATLPTGELIGRAHGDDRGEFFLLVGIDPVNHGDLVSPLRVTVTVIGPEPVPDPLTDPAAAVDPLWDLPLEVAASPGRPDPVCAGEELPASYKQPGRLAIRNVDLPLGRITSDPVPYEPVP